MSFFQVTTYSETSQDGTVVRTKLGENQLKRHTREADGESDGIDKRDVEKRSSKELINLVGGILKGGLFGR